MHETVVCMYVCVCVCVLVPKAEGSLGFVEKWEFWGQFASESGSLCG